MRIASLVLLAALSACAVGPQEDIGEAAGPRASGAIVSELTLQGLTRCVMKNAASAREGITSQERMDGRRGEVVMRSTMFPGEPLAVLRVAETTRGSAGTLSISPNATAPDALRETLMKGCYRENY